MPLESHQLRLLYEIHRGGSLARAAKTLGITPPSVSQQLTQLERQLDSVLVERGARGARLTAPGLLLVRRAEAVLAQLSQAEGDVASYLGAHTRRLRLGAFPSAAVTLLPEALTALRHRHPDSELSVIDLVSDQGSALVDAGELDLALTASYGQRLDRPAGVRFVHLRRDPIRVVLPLDHRLASEPGDGPIALDMLRKDAWVCGIAGRPARRQLEEAARSRGFRPAVPFQTESYDVAQALVAAGVAVAFVPQGAVTASPVTVTRNLVEPSLHRDIYVVLPTSTEHVVLAEILLELLVSGQSGEEPAE
jgi:molybdate transport repressor ModE-like protein